MEKKEVRDSGKEVRPNRFSVTTVKGLKLVKDEDTKEEAPEGTQRSTKV